MTVYIDYDTDAMSWYIYNVHGETVAEGFESSVEAEHYCNGNGWMCD